MNFPRCDFGILSFRDSNTLGSFVVWKESCLTSVAAGVPSRRSTFCAFPSLVMVLRTRAYPLSCETPRTTFWQL